MATPPLDLAARLSDEYIAGRLRQRARTVAIIRRLTKSGHVGALTKREMVVLIDDLDVIRSGP